jgi:hypothetical protein
MSPVRRWDLNNPTKHGANDSTPDVLNVRQIMYTPLVYGCFGLISLSALAGCGGLINKHRDDCACICRPIAFTDERHVIVTPLEPSGTPATAPISISLPPTGAAPKAIVAIETANQRASSDKVLPPRDLPAANYNLPERSVPFKSDSIALGRNGTVEIIGPGDVLPIPIPTQNHKLVPRETVRSIQDPAILLQPQILVFNPSPKPKSSDPMRINIPPAHSDDFAAITGQVQQYLKTWRLRYASIDQEDIHGGVVVLEGGADLNQLRDGQHVRVTGVLVPPATRTSSATYRVQAIEILD